MVAGFIDGGNGYAHRLIGAVTGYGNGQGSGGERAIAARDNRIAFDYAVGQGICALISCYVPTGVIGLPAKGDLAGRGGMTELALVRSRRECGVQQDLVCDARAVAGVVDYFHGDGADAVAAVLQLPVKGGGDIGQGFMDGIGRSGGQASVPEIDALDAGTAGVVGQIQTRNDNLPGIGRIFRGIINPPSGYGLDHKGVGLCRRRRGVNGHLKTFSYLRSGIIPYINLQPPFPSSLRQVNRR